MKKYLALLLALVLGLALFAGCGKEKPAGDSEARTETPAVTTAPENTEPAALRLVLVTDGALGDGGVFDSARAGCETLAAELALELSLTECAPGTFAAQLRSAAEQADYVVCVSREPYELGTLAAEYPEVRWVCVDSLSAEEAANAANLSFKQNEGAFLAGYLAASVSKTGVVGAVGGKESPIVNDYIIGFEQGARYFREDVTVLYDYIEADGDAAAAKACALGLSDQGADVILQAASTAGAGVFEAARERGFLVVGTDADWTEADPDHLLCSIEKLVGEAVADAVRGQRWGQSYAGGLVDGFVSLSYGGGAAGLAISEETKTEISQIAAGICDGTIVVDGIIR